MSGFARRPSSSGSDSGSCMTPPIKNNTRQDNEMVTVIDFRHEIMTYKNDAEKFQAVTSQLVEQIRCSLADSKLVLIKGWKRELPVSFSPVSLKLTFGEIGRIPSGQVSRRAKTSGMDSTHAARIR